MIATVVRSLVLSVAILFAMWASSLQIYDSEKMADALEWRWAELNGEAIYAWAFDAPTEVTHGHGLGKFSWVKGTVKGDYPDPYFYLNLEGRYIDARRFTEIRLRIYSETNNALRLFHFQGPEDQIHASELVPVDAGWQELTLDLPTLKWHAKNLNDPDGLAPDSSWGGPTGVVTALRIDPVRSGAFEVDWIELRDAGNRPRLTEDVESFVTPDDELFDRMSQDSARTWHIAHDNWWRTPETAHHTRMKIAQAYPSAIVFPRLPSEEELSYPPFERGVSSAFLPACFFIAALLLMVVRDHFPTPWRSLTAVVALFALAEAYVFWMPNLSVLWRGLLVMPLIGAMWELAPKSAPRYLIGDTRAWLWVAPLILASVLVLFMVPYESFTDFSVPKALMVYFVWALFQQFVVAVLIQSRLKTVFGKLGIVVSAGLYGFMHFPNFALMVITFLFGIYWLIIYERYQNLFATSAAQAFVSVGFNTLALQYFWLSRTVGPAFTTAL